jgi:hypothetical protein
MTNTQSAFGEQMDSLSDMVSFGAAPALISYIWALKGLGRWGWFAAFVYCACAALRLARFNARIDMAEQPHKSAGFLTGVPAPVGAGLAFLPLYLWIASGREEFREPIAVAAWDGAREAAMVAACNELPARCEHARGEREFELRESVFRERDVAIGDGLAEREASGKFKCLLRSDRPRGAFAHRRTAGRFDAFGADLGAAAGPNRWCGLCHGD